jgi:hypothetical protein
MRLPVVAKKKIVSWACGRFVAVPTSEHVAGLIPAKVSKVLREPHPSEVRAVQVGQLVRKFPAISNAKRVGTARRLDCRCSRYADDQPSVGI